MQSDNYLSQVKINVKQLTTAILKTSGEFFDFQHGIVRAVGTQSALDNQLSCLYLSLA